MLEHLGPLRDALYDEIVSRVQETDASAPVRHGPYEYFTRTIEGQQYDVHCRRPAGTVGLPDPSAAPGASPGEEVVLDENALAAGHEFFTVGDLIMSPSHDIVAFTVDTDGGERHELRFRDVGAGRPAAPTSSRTCTTGWRSPTTTAPCCTSGPTRRCARSRCGATRSVPVPTTTCSCTRRTTSATSSRSTGPGAGGCWSITAASKVTTEVRLLDADDPTTAASVVAPRERGHEYHVEHHDGPAGEQLFVLSNAGGENFGLYVTPRPTPGREHWTPVIAPRASTCGSRTSTRSPIASSSRSGRTPTSSSACSTSADDGAVVDDHVIAPPDPVGSMWLGLEPGVEPGEPALRLHVDGRSAVGVRLRPDDAHRDPRRSSSPFPATTPTHYETERRWAIAPDGTRVPISLVWRRDVAPLDHAPMLLYGYGAYEVSIDPMFSTSRVSLLDRGVAYAIAHVRGGGELGRGWYEQGKLLAKPNTFTDFVACAQHLVDLGVTAPDRLVARGGSAGGLLMGAVANLAPGLFRAIVAEVPFVDMPHDDARRVAAVDGHRVGRVGRSLDRRGRVRRDEVVLPVRQRRGEGLSGDARHRRASTIPACSTGSPPSGSPSCGPRSPTATSCC